jgi:hypothetical protein
MRRGAGRAVGAVPIAAVAAVLSAGPASAADADTTCRLTQQGSTATATCHNPDPTAGRVQLHVACARWWDPPTDTPTVTVSPAEWVTLTGHCWKEVRTAWLTRE